MDRSSFLKTLAAGVAMPSIFTGCSNSDNGESGLIDPGIDEAMSKTADHTEPLNPDHYKISLFRDENGMFFFNPTTHVDNIYVYNGFWQSKHYSWCFAVAHYNSVEKTLSITTNIDSAKWYMLSVSSLQKFYDKYMFVGFDMGLNEFRFGDFRKTTLRINKGEFPGMYDGIG